MLHKHSLDRMSKLTFNNSPIQIMYMLHTVRIKGCTQFYYRIFFRVQNLQIFC